MSLEHFNYLCIYTRAYFGIPIALDYNYILLGSLCYDTFKLLVELFNRLISVVCGWCIDLDECDVV